MKLILTIDLLISGGWDATIKLWDPRADNACVGTYKQPDKVFTMSVTSTNESPKLVVGTAGRNVHIYDLRNMEEPLQVLVVSFSILTWY